MHIQFFACTTFRGPGFFCKNVSHENLYLYSTCVLQKNPLQFDTCNQNWSYGIQHDLMIMSVSTLTRNTDISHTCMSWEASDENNHRKCTSGHGPWQAPPTSAFVPSARPSVSIQVWSHHGHECVGGQRGCRHGQCPSGSMFACALSCEF